MGTDEDQIVTDARQTDHATEKCVAIGGILVPERFPLIISGRDGLCTADQYNRFACDIKPALSDHLA